MNTCQFKFSRVKNTYYNEGPSFSKSYVLGVETIVNFKKHKLHWILKIKNDGRNS